jgi:hypothetical protein
LIVLLINTKPLSTEDKPRDENPAQLLGLQVLGGERIEGLRSHASKVKQASKSRSIHGWP